MGAIVCKFGGTSLANAACIKKALDIVRSNPERRFVVPSAPGKRDESDKKVTDLLYGWYHLLQDGLDPDQPIRIIRERFAQLAHGLGSAVDVEGLLADIAVQAQDYDTPDYLASRGEFLNAKILADVLGATFVEPAECIRFNYEGLLDPVTYATLAERLDGDGVYVIPGFYGTDPDGRVRTFGRGGSDVTGAIVARAANCSLYENWTDVSGIRMTDPRIVPEAKQIHEITYAELRELAYMGASVLHDEAIFPVREVGIPIHIRNTWQPADNGTLIVPDRVSEQPVCGIASRAGFSMINIEKTLMNREVGFARRVLSVLEEHRVSVEHIPTGIDSMSVIVKDEVLDRHGDAVVDGIKRICQPDSISITNNLALVATVGKAMNHHVGVAARLCTALADANVNVRVLDQGSSEMNIIVGVEREDMETAVRAIYNAFENWK